MLLEGRTALVTGSGRNIGRATILAYAKEGANVVVNARSNQEEVDAVVKEAQDIGVKAIGVLADISDPASVQAMADKVLSTFGKVDILVNNAAIRSPRPFTEIDYAEWRRVISVDLDGAFHCIKAFLPGMLEQSWGRIINISGTNARTGGNLSGGARNVALVHMTKTLSSQLGRYGITVNCIHPGTTRTERTPGVLAARAAELGITVKEQEQQDFAPGSPQGNAICRMVDASEIAYLTVFLASDRGWAVTGEVIAATGGAGNSVYY